MRATRIELVGVDRLMAGGEQAIDLAEHAGRCDANAVGFGERGFRVAHARVELREVHVLHLDRAAAGQFVIQMLPSAAERLPRALRFGSQAIAVRAGRVGQQVFVELIAIGGDVRKQVRERDVGVVAIGAVAGRAGGHQDRAGEHGGRFEHQLVASWRLQFASLPFLPLVGASSAREQRVERHLLQHEPAVVAAIVDVVADPTGRNGDWAACSPGGRSRRPADRAQALRQAADRTRLVGGFRDRSRSGSQARVRVARGKCRARRRHL